MKNLLAYTGLSVVFSLSALADEVIYQSHFEDERHHLEGWGVQDGAVDDVVLEVRAGENSDEAVFLKVATPAMPDPVRIAQRSELFFLRPGQTYTLSAKVRVNDLSVGQKGRVRIFVTNARWSWSSDSISLKTIHPDWEEFSVQFTLPEDPPEDQVGRIRIEIINASSDFDIASLKIQQSH